MWLFCGGMQRSGSTLQYQLVSSVIERAGVGERGGWVGAGNVRYEIRQHDLSGHRTLKSHVPTQCISNMLNGGNARGFYIYRDLRDVIVSTMNHHSLPFDKVWQSGMITDSIDWGRVWEDLPWVLTQRYEDLVNDIKFAVWGICHHLDIEMPLIGRLDIANVHSIAHQRKRIAKIPNGTGWDKSELLHHRHISKGNGSPGQWQSSLTPGQVKLVEQRYGTWLTKHGYKLS